MKKFIILLFISVSVINVYILLNRNIFDFTKQSSYFELYPSYNSLSIKAFEPIGDSAVKLILNNGPSENDTNKWIITNSSTNNVDTQLSLNPVLQLSNGIASYTIRQDKTNDSLYVEAEYIPKAQMLLSKIAENGRITILQSDLPVKEKNPSIQKWQNNKIPTTTDELSDVRTILKDSIKVIATDNDFTKAQKITTYLCRRISGAKGNMSDSVRQLSVYQQLSSALRSSKIDCGVYSNIFSLFATEAGITNRIVESKHNYGTFNKNIHVFNEYYISEKKVWVATDLMFNNINYYGSNGHLLNAVEVKNLLPTDSLVTVKHSIPETDSLRTSKYSQLSNDFHSLYKKDKDLYFYYDTNLKNIYKTRVKLKSYFSKNPWYEIYSDVAITDNKLFYIKQIFSYVWMVAALLLLIAIIPFVRKNKRS